MELLSCHQEAHGISAADWSGLIGNQAHALVPDAINHDLSLGPLLQIVLISIDGDKCQEPIRPLKPQERPIRGHAQSRMVRIELACGGHVVSPLRTKARLCARSRRPGTLCTTTYSATKLRQIAVQHCSRRHRFSKMALLHPRRMRRKASTGTGSGQARTPAGAHPWGKRASYASPRWRPA